jgi:predicted HicB family RNase H-like nuclease
MTGHFEYKGYLGSAEVDAENNVLFGRLLFIRDVIGYSAATVQDMRQAFEEAVDDYLEACAERHEEPDVPCKGSFNVRIGPERHRTAAMRAREKGVGLNEYVCWALDEVARTPATVVHRYEVTVTAAQEWQATTASQGTWEVSSGAVPN